MGLYASKGGGGNFVPVSAGVHLALCYAVYDLGTHQVTFGDKTRELHKALVMWEVEDETIEIEKDGKMVEMPRVVSKEYTLSLDDRSHLYKDLVSWRGRAFTDEEEKQFDIKNLIGKPCQVNVVHGKSLKTGNTFANVETIMPITKSQKADIPSMPKTPIKFYSMEDHGGDIPEGTPDWVKDKIRSSIEWTHMVSPEDWAEENHNERVDIPDDSVPF